MKKEELRWIFLFAGILACLTTIPYIAAFSAAGEKWEFSGFLFGVRDGNSYIAKMLLGSNGAWLFKTPYTTVPQHGVLAFVPYLLLGKLAAGSALHEQLVALFHLFRILATPLAVYATYRFASLFIEEIFWRRFATLLGTVGGGLSWLAIIFKQGQLEGFMPVEWYSPEWFGFLSYFGIPHLVLARGLLLLALGAYIQAGKQRVGSWKAGLWFLALAFIHPLSLVSGFAVIGFHQAALWIFSIRQGSWKLAKQGLTGAVKSLLIPLPLLAYFIYNFSTDPFLKIWTAQNRILSPPPIHLLLAYGLLVIPSTMGAVKLMKKQHFRALFLMGWIVSLPFLAYAPHNLQRRLPEGIFVAWATLTAVGISAARKFTQQRKQTVGAGLIGLSIPSSVILVLVSGYFALNPSSPAFQPSAEISSFRWLAEEVEPGSHVLSAFASGNSIPAWAPVNVVLGHGPESVNASELEYLIQSFFSGEMEPQEEIAFLQEQAVDYIFYGPKEQAYGPWGSKAANRYELIYDQEGYQIYAVEPEQ